MFCVKKYIYYEEKMKLLLTFALLFTCFCVVRVQSVKSDSSRSIILRRLFEKGFTSDSIRTLSKKECCKRGDIDISDLLRKTTNKRSSTKRSCYWCHYTMKVEPGSESDQFEDDTNPHWHPSSYQRKSRHAVRWRR